jgi:hypothetical protein
MLLRARHEWLVLEEAKRNIGDFEIDKKKCLENVVKIRETIKLWLENANSDADVMNSTDLWISNQCKRHGIACPELH